MSKVVVLTAFLLSVLCPLQSFAQDPTEIIFRAEQGDPVAQTKLGVMYIIGRGVERDCAKGIALYQKAARKGHLQAINNLGVEYHRGRCLARDDREAVRYYTMAAEAGHVGAQNNLGALYKKGEGVKKDYPEAIKWYLRTAASMKGGPGVYNELGELFEVSSEIRNHFEIAAQFYTVAAEANVAKAMTNLGRLYLNGQGVNRDEKIAKSWFQKALIEGDSSARNYLVP